MRKIFKILSGAYRYILLIGFLIVVNVLLDVMLTLWSSQAMKDLIGSRMLDITNTAADMIDGDVLKDLSPKDRGTPEYESTMKILTYFRDNIELKCIYCIMDKGNKNFVFGLDPTTEDPGEFGSPVVYTDALYQASLGTAAFNVESYEDAEGTFYSAYSPVFTSDGKVAGIVAVDFSKDWYDKQMKAQTHTILLVNTLLLVTSGFMILFMVRSERKRRKAAEQLGATADIYLLMYEANIPNDTFTEVYNNKSAARTRIKNISTSAREVARDITERYSDSTTKAGMLEFVNMDTLSDRMKNTNTITHEFLSSENRWLRGRFIVLERASSGEVIRVMYLVENIDSEKRKRDAISEEAMNLNYQISSISNIYIVVYDVDLTDNKFSIIKSENMIVNSLVGKQRTDTQAVINKVMEAITDESKLDEMMRFIDLSTLESRLSNTDTVTLEFITKTKKWIRIRFLASRRTNLGKLSHVLWLAEDINEEKMERDKLIDMSERAIAANEAKSSFLSNMSHEIRTPINAVLGMNEMILRECTDENILSYSNSIMNAGTTLLGIVNDILDFSKIEAGKMEIIPANYDLSTTINDLVSMIQPRADDKDLTLVPDMNSRIPKLLYGDEVRIKQVITNLLTNAVKYTEKGCVKFSIDFKKVHEEPNSVILCISVTDTGIGIKPEDMDKLFSEFDRIEEERNRNIEGTGLGMSITQRLLRMMGSSLEVESVYGMGSKFYFEIKQKVIKWEELGDYEAAYKETLEKRRKYHVSFKAPAAEVLIVDDTPMNLMVFKNLLKQTGMKIDTAGSGDEGISAALENIYDIIFLDHMMPEKDGIQTLREMKAISNNPNLNTVTICLTANAISGAREQYISAGFDDYITKPIDPTKLEEILIQYLPEDKVMYLSDDDEQEGEKTSKSSLIPPFVNDIDEIDVQKGTANCGDEESYLSTLITYANTLDGYISDIQEHYGADDIPNATIRIHALKSMTKIVGASELGEMAQELENAGNAGDTQTLADNIGEFLERFRKLSEQLSPLKEQTEWEDDSSLPPISDDEYTEAGSIIIELSEDCDYDGIMSVIDGLKKYRLTEEQKDKMSRVQQAADDFEFESIPDILG